MRRIYIFSVQTLILTILTGCQLLAPYKGPITPTPDHWKTTYDAPDAGVPTIPPDWKDNSSGQPSSPPLEDPYENKTSNDIPEEPPEPKTPNVEDLRRDLGDWWKVFHDPILDELEEQALNSSYTLWAALEKVIQARAQAAMNFSPLLPNIDFSPGFKRTGLLFQNPFSNQLGGSSSSGSKQLPSSVSALEKMVKNSKSTTSSSSNLLSGISSDFRFVQTQYLVPLSLSYEVDLWGQLHNAFYASVNEAQASYQSYLGVLLSLTADVANAYFQLRGLDGQQEVIQNNIRVRQRAVDVNEARYKAGIITYMDVSKAIVEVARAHSDSDDVRRARAIQENTLATLVGIPPSVFSLEYDPLIVPPPVIPTGIPSELLCRRPDVASAERQLAASYREIGVAYANFFPSFGLNAALGFESPMANQLFSWKSRLWEVGMQAVQSVFDGGRNKANYEYYKSVFRETLANYEETALKAFKDVENSLAELRGYAIQAKDLRIAVKYARITLDLAQMRYTRGLTTYLDVVDAERQLLETEQNSVIILGNRYISTVMLIRALGGSWGSCEECFQDETIASTTTSEELEDRDEPLQQDL